MVKTIIYFLIFCGGLAFLAGGGTWLFFYIVRRLKEEKFIDTYTEE